MSGLSLVVSDAHEGLKQAIGAACGGVGWKRCRVHLLRNILAQVPKVSQPLVATLVLTLFVQPDAAGVHQTLGKVADRLQEHFPRAATIFRDAEDDVLAYTAFPAEHWRQMWSTNPLERLNKEIKRRTAAIGIFFNRAAALRLVGAVLLEQHEEWATSVGMWSEYGTRRAGRIPPPRPAAMDASAMLALPPRAGDCGQSKVRRPAAWGDRPAPVKTPAA